MKLFLKTGLLLALLVTMMFAVWAGCDSQAIPKTVDAVRNVVGDRAVLKMEEVYYGFCNRRAEAAYLVKVKAGKAKIHQEVKIDPPPPTFAQKATPFDMAVLGKDGKESQTAHPGEGQWIDKGWYLRTFVYPEPKLESIADIALIDGSRVSLKMVCGTKNPAPGGTGRIPAEDLPRALMVFSGGFQYKHDYCGMVVGGKVMRPMKRSAGTLVVFRDGSIKIGKWGRDFTQVTDDMMYVRQCLLLVDGGKFNDKEPYDIFALGKKVKVYRSALGITKDGNLVYAAGNKLSARGLAKAMIAVRAVSAIHLDMNYGNATCGIFAHSGEGLKILPLTSRFPNPGRFLGTNYRDFMYVVFKEKAGSGESEGKIGGKQSQNP